MKKGNLFNLSGIAVTPTLFDKEGKFNSKTNLGKIEENIRIELMTSRGTQPGNPEMGSDIYKKLKFGKSMTTATMIRYEIDRVFEEKFPDLSIKNIDIEFRKSTVIMNLQYEIKKSNVNSNVFLEFITNEGGN